MKKSFLRDVDVYMKIMWETLGSEMTGVSKTGSLGDTICQPALVGLASSANDRL